MAKFFVLLGIAGSGKGTQCILIQRSYENVFLISPGAIIREFLKKSDSFAEEIAGEVAAGRLLNDELIMRLVSESLNSIKIYDNSCVIFDGIPRSYNQALMLNELLLKKFSDSISCVLHLNIKKRYAIKRLSSRLVCNDCGIATSIEFSTCFHCGGNLVKRVDDKISVARKRIYTDQKSIQFLLDFYLNNGVKCAKIRAHSCIYSVFRHVRSIILS